MPARPHRALGVILVRLRIAEINQHAVTHVFGDKPAEAAHGVGDSTADSAEMTSRRSSGSMRAESAVEPTRSQNITVTWRRSASRGRRHIARVPWSPWRRASRRVRVHPRSVRR